jgi:hypothetical protein
MVRRPCETVGMARRVKMPMLGVSGDYLGERRIDG